jgi:hypothetical protein
MELMAADVDEPTGMRVPPPLDRVRDALKRDARENQEEHDGGHRHSDAAGSPREQCGH